MTSGSVVGDVHVGQKDTRPGYYVVTPHQPASGDCVAGTIFSNQPGIFIKDKFSWRWYLSLPTQSVADVRRAAW